MPTWNGTEGNNYFNASHQAIQDWTVYGNGGDDHLIGNGSETIYGGNGQDLIMAWGGNNYLYGNSGNDVLHLSGTSSNASFLSGGDGDDTYILESNNIFLQESSSVFPGGVDTCLLVGNSIIEYTLPSYVENVKASGTHWLPVPLPNPVYNINNTATVTIRGNNLNNLIIANNISNKLYGGEGYDQIFGKDGHDALYGEGADDNLQGGNGRDSLFGGVGNDYLVGYDASQTTDADYDELWGGSGADAFVLGSSFGAFYGDSTYATIRDFNWVEGDKFHAFGSAFDYSTSFLGNTTFIYYRDDLIAFVQNTTDVVIAEDFVFVN